MRRLLLKLFRRRTLQADLEAGNYFTALRVPVAYGRGFTAADTGDVVVLHHQFWQKRFNGDPAIVGRGIDLDGRAYTVLGILPQSHRTLMGFGLSPDVYRPRCLPDTLLTIYARLKPGMSPREGLAALQTVAARMDQSMPESFKHVDGLRVTPIAGLARLLLLAGSAAGLCIALFVTKPLAVFFVPGLGAADPWSFAAGSAVLAPVVPDPSRYLLY